MSEFPTSDEEFELRYEDELELLREQDCKLNFILDLIENVRLYMCLLYPRFK